MRADIKVLTSKFARLARCIDVKKRDVEECRGQGGNQMTHEIWTL